MGGCTGPSLPPCFDVPKGVSTIVLGHHPRGLEVVFLDSEGKVIPTERPPIITCDVAVEVKVSSETSSDVKRSNFHFGVYNGSQLPDVFKQKVIDNW